MKNLFLAAFMLPMISGMAQSSNDQISNLQAQIDELKVMAENHQIGATPPAGYPKIADEVGLRFEIGGLYQNAVLGGTEYASIVLNHQGAIYSGSDSQIYQPEAKMSWGLNGAVSYYCQEHGYELKLKNSYYDLSTSSSIEINEGKLIGPLFYNDYFSAPFETSVNIYSKSASSNLDITYDLLGLVLQKSFFVNRYFSIEAIGGILGSWTWFTHVKIYDELFFMVEDADPDWFLYRKDHSSWFGVGPEIGLNSNFMLGSGFSVFFNNTCALMYGKFEVEFYQNAYIADIEEIEQEVRIAYSQKASDHRIMPYIQTFMGIAYEFFAGYNKHFLKLRAGYNTQYFISANTMIRYNGDDTSQLYFRSNENLQTQGLLFDLAWSF